MFNRIAIMGAGSLGTILGAYLTKGGLDVTFVDAYEEHVKALNEKGAKVIGWSEFTTPAKACTPDKMEGVFDLFIYMTKQTFNETAIPQMVAHCDDKTIICCCQNGVPEMEVAKYFPAERICGAPVGWGATFQGPGVSEVTTEEGPRYFSLGSYDGNEYPWLQDVKAVLENMCEVHLGNNLIGDRWAKLVINAGFSGMSTVIGATFGDVVDNPISVQCLAMIYNETWKVTKAAGIDMHTDFANINSFEEKKALEAQLTENIKASRRLLASMLQDLTKGRKCEIQQIDGVVCEVGDKYNIDTPFTDMVVKVVSEIEQGKRKPCFDNLKDFEPLIAAIKF